jgi:hypothetical protein
LLNEIKNDGRFELAINERSIKGNTYLMFTKINGEKVSMKEVKDMIDMVGSVDHCAFCNFRNIYSLKCSDTQMLLDIDTESG